MEQQTRIYLILFAILFVFSLLLLNGGRAIYKALSSFKTISPKIFYTVYIAVFAFFILVFVKTIFTRAGIESSSLFSGLTLIKSSLYAFGLIAYIVVFGNLAYVIYLLLKAFKVNNMDFYSKFAKFGSAALLLTIAILFIYGAINSMFIKQKKYTVSFNKSEVREEVTEASLKNIKGLKIAMISDIHLGYINDNAHMQKLVNIINDMNPDIVLMPGDIFDDEYHAIKDPDKTIEIFKSIKSKYGVYATWGNHDSGDTFDKMEEMLNKADVKILNDEKEVIDGKFVLVGRIDPNPIGMFKYRRSEAPELTEEEKKLPVIAMDHRPDNIEEFKNYADLLVCGHTHNGQFFPFNLAVSRIYPTHYGHFVHDDGNPQVVVTSGAGTWGPPLRVGCNSEVVEIVVE